PTLELLSPTEQEERKRLLARVQTLSRELSTLEEAADREYETEERKWRAPNVVEAVSKGGATLTAQKDGVVAGSGKTPQEDDYSVTLTLSAGTHTALRLEVLPEKLASGELAVGRNGQNFVLSELTVELLDAAGAHPLKLTRARVDFAAEKKPVAAAIDDDEKTGWSVSPRTHERHSALFDFAEPLQLTAEAKLRVTLSQQAGEVLTLRRFRLSTSAADPATLRPRTAAPPLRKLRDELAGAYQAQR